MPPPLSPLPETQVTESTVAPPWIPAPSLPVQQEQPSASTPPASVPAAEDTTSRPGSSHSVFRLPTVQSDIEEITGTVRPVAQPNLTLDEVIDLTSDDPAEEDTSRPESPQPALHSPLVKPENEDVSEYFQTVDHPVVPSNILVVLPVSTLINPRSLFIGHDDPAQLLSERDALTHLIRAARADKTRDGPKDEFEFELDQFSIYIDGVHFPRELRSLQQLSTRRGRSTMYFDGVLSYGDVKYFVRKVPFRFLPIGNYEVEHDPVGDAIWIHSKRNKDPERNIDRKIYYRLKRPSLEYARFHEPFLWVADLTKHFVNFASVKIDQGQQITLADFQERFCTWLHQTYAGSPGFEKWYQHFGRVDFRPSIVANLDFIYKEIHDGLDDLGEDELTIFDETLHFKRYKEQPGPLAPPPKADTEVDSGTPAIIPQEASPSAAAEDSEDFAEDPGDISDVKKLVSKKFKKPPAKTIVTPYIHDCFSHMGVGCMLQSVNSSLNEDQVTNFNAASREPVTHLPANEHVNPAQRILDIQPGDVISTAPDQDTSGTKWRKEKSKGFEGEDRWYAVVRKVSVRKRTRLFDVTWLYRPVDTPCGQMKYPWPKELFLSDHCTCEEGSDSNIHADEVLGIHSVEWMGEPNTEAEFFVRQMYIASDRRWITLEKKHLQCIHYDNGPQYQPGDTVLARTSEYDLEPFEVVESTPLGLMKLRKFLRRHRVDSSASNAPPNELVSTDSFTTSNGDAIVGRCVIRAFSYTDKIPTPYDRNGTGNLFYVTHRETEDGAIIPLSFNESVSFRQGFDPTKSHFQKLRGLDLFSGCGNFGRGLEDGGAVEMLWANDIWAPAAHTYMANASPKAHAFLGSVDDLLHHALLGRFSESVPRPDQVDFISGGSPCPGFSLLTGDKSTVEQVKNRSLVASFASFIDFYRPKYGILENVPTIVQNGIQRSEDIFSQLICALVGLGYQVEIMLGNAWAYGSPQSRSRVFLYFAAPGRTLPKIPLPSHSNPKVYNKSLGKLNNGENYVEPYTGPTAFKFVSAAAATADLPPIDDAKPDICVRFPYHRITAGLTQKVRLQIHNIPRFPLGMNFIKAWNNGKEDEDKSWGFMTTAARAVFPARGDRVTKKESRSWMRVSPNELFSTVTTTCMLAEARTGRILHWKEQRPVSIEEVRRAQGIPAEDILLGNPVEQWKLVGNAVARQPAVALGLAFREAVESLYEDGRPSEAVAQDLQEVAAVDEMEVMQVDEGRQEEQQDDKVDAAILTVEHETRVTSQVATPSTTGADADASAIVTVAARSELTPATTVSETLVQISTVIANEGENKRSLLSVSESHIESDILEGPLAKRPRLDEQ